jgi:hypothetical protein
MTAASSCKEREGGPRSEGRCGRQLVGSGALVLGWIWCTRHSDGGECLGMLT